MTGYFLMLALSVVVIVLGYLWLLHCLDGLAKAQNLEERERRRQ